ncbi:hypothetical protein SGLAM104S_08969 [Streptomyces glaucescens]
MTAPVKIADSGWTHDKLTYDGHGHLYGTTAAGLLLRYNVTEDSGGLPAHRCPHRDRHRVRAEDPHRHR